MPLDKFGNHYEIRPAIGSTKHNRSFTVQLNYEQEEPHGTTRSPCHLSTSVRNIKPKGAECDGEGLSKTNIIDGHGGVITTVAAAVKAKLQVFSKVWFKAEVAAEKCQERRVVHKEEVPTTYEEWFDKPGEVDTLGDI